MYIEDFAALLEEYSYLDVCFFKNENEIDLPETTVHVIKNIPSKMLRQKRLSKKNKLRDKAKHGVNMKYWLPRNKTQYDHFRWNNEPNKGNVKKNNSIWKMELDLC